MCNPYNRETIHLEMLASNLATERSKQRRPRLPVFNAVAECFVCHKAVAFALIDICLA